MLVCGDGMSDCVWFVIFFVWWVVFEFGCGVVCVYVFRN